MKRKNHTGVYALPRAFCFVWSAVVWYGCCCCCCLNLFFEAQLSSNNEAERHSKARREHEWEFIIICTWTKYNKRTHSHTERIEPKSPKKEESEEHVVRKYRMKQKEFISKISKRWARAGARERREKGTRVRERERCKRFECDITKRPTNEFVCLLYVPTAVCVCAARVNIQNRNHQASSSQERPNEPIDDYNGYDIPYEFLYVWYSAFVCLCDIVFAADGRFYVCFFSLFNSRACSSGGGNGNPWSSSSFIFLMCIIIYSNGDCGIAQHLRWNLIRIWNLLSFFLSSLLHSAPVCGSTPFHCVFIFDSLCMRAAFRGLCVTRHVLRFVSSTAEDDSVGFECVWVCRRDFNSHID